MSESDNRMEMTALEYIVEAQAVKLEELMSVEEYEQFAKETARGAFRAWIKGLPDDSPFKEFASMMCEHIISRVDAELDAVEK